MRGMLAGGVVVFACLGCRTVGQDGDSAAVAKDKQTAAADGTAPAEPAKIVEPPKIDADKAFEMGSKKVQLERQLAIDRKKVARAQMDLEGLDQSTRVAIEKARAELDMATAALRLFDESDAPIKTVRAKLEVQEAEDYLADQREEMQQLEMMYKQDDLADKTKEIVLRRGQRRLERAMQRLDVQKAETDKLLNKDLAETRRRLQLTVAEKQSELARQERAVQTDRLDKEMAVMGAQGEVSRNEEELSHLNEKLSQMGKRP